ncbi:hypothetical protein N9301_04150 [Paracoccaceae bacterium]|nr:hypothetical protein [Paracoccaceae bacterium]
MAIITVLALAACSGNQQSQFDMKSNLYAGQTRTHTATECVLISYFLISDGKNKQWAENIAKITDGNFKHALEDEKYKHLDGRFSPIEEHLADESLGKSITDACIGNHKKTRSTDDAWLAFLAGMGAGLANQQTTAPRTNRIINCTTTSTGYLTSGLITNCYK